MIALTNRWLTRPTMPASQSDEKLASHDFPFWTSSPPLFGGLPSHSACISALRRALWRLLASKVVQILRAWAAFRTLFAPNFSFPPWVSSGAVMVADDEPAPGNPGIFDSVVDSGSDFIAALIAMWVVLGRMSIAATSAAGPDT